MTDLPVPLTPADCDLQDFKFMPLHVSRLRDSDLASMESPEGCWFAVLLWCAAWHQLPAASIPDNENVICRLIGLGRDLKTFRKHRATILRGFILCSDGRLYHPVIAEQALKAWEGKRQQRFRSECARIKKANQRNDTSIPIPTYDEFVLGDNPVVSPGTEPVVPGETASKRKGQGQGKGKGQGEYKKDVDDDAGANPLVLVEPNFEHDLIALTNAICRSAGIRHIDPGTISRHIAIVKGWLDEGFDVATVIQPSIREAIAKATERIGSLSYFDRSVRQYHARREAHAHGHASNTAYESQNPMVRAAGARLARSAAARGDDDQLRHAAGDRA
jgi:hypothetical protein